MTLSAHDLSVGYGSTTVGSGIDLVIQRGETWCLLGPNGCGKTTLLRTLLGLIKPLAGHVRFNGEDLSSLSRAQLAQHIAYVPQSHSPPFTFRAIDIVLMGRSARLARFAQPGREDRDIAYHALQELGIEGLAESDYTRLSSGQRQLVLIARALAQRAELIIMDEPTASLDFGNQARLLQQIMYLTQDTGRSVVLSTHHPDQAFALHANVAVMKSGGLMACGSARGTLTAALLSEVYDTPICVEQTNDGRWICQAAAPGSSSGGCNSAARSSSR